MGSALIPQKFVTLKNSSGLVAGYAEGFMEIQKFFHSMNHAELCGSVVFSQYNANDIADGSVGNGGVTAVTANTGSTSYRNGFAIAQNLETYSQRNDVMINGLNTLSSQTFF